MSGNLWMFSDKLDDEDIEIMNGSSEENKSEEKPASNQTDSDDSSGSDDVSVPLGGSGGDCQAAEPAGNSAGVPCQCHDPGLQKALPSEKGSAGSDRHV